VRSLGKRGGVADDDVMDVEAVREQLARAIAQQAGSLVTLALLAGALHGAAAAGLKDQLQTFARAEVADTQRLIEKLSCIGRAAAAV
jgi:hypothetical protein